MKRIKNINREKFKKNLKEVLRRELIKCIDIEAFVEDAVEKWMLNGNNDGCYEVERYLTESGHTEVIRTR